MQKKRFPFLLLLAAVLCLVTGCSRFDYSLPDDPVAFHNGTFVNPADQNDTYYSVTYHGRIYIPYGKLQKGGMNPDELGRCLGYQVQDGSEDKNMRFFALAGDENTDFLMRKYIGGFMDQPDFFRAVDTKYQDITVPACIAPDEDDLFWTDWCAVDQAKLDELSAQYPEYFKLSSFKGIEIYVWEMAAGDYQCGLMSGTNRNKTDSEIQSLKPLTVAEAKLILNSLGIPKEEWIVIPVVQPHSSYSYTIDEAYRENVQKLFDA